MAFLEVKFDFSKCALCKPDFAHKVIFVELQKYIRFSLNVGRAIAQQHTPTGATGQLIGSIVTELAKGVRMTHSGKISWKASYAETVARGGPPRKVPLADLVAWASAVLGEPNAAVAISINIERRGTPSPNHPNPGILMDLKTADEWTPRAMADFVNTVDHIVRRLNGA